MPFRTVLTAVVLFAATAAAQPPARLDIHGDPLPPGAIARLGTSRLRPAVTPEFTADGKALVTGAGHTGLRLWDAVSGKLLARADVPLASEWLAITPDGRWVAAESQDGVCLWEPRTGRRVAVALDGDNQLLITALAFAPDGGQLAVATLERRTDRVSVRVLSVPDGREQFRFGDHKTRVFFLTFTPDGTLVSIDTSHNACYHAHTGELQRQSALSTDKADFVGLSPNGRWVVRSQRTGGPLSVWDVTTGQRQCELDDVGGLTRQLQFTADCQFLAELVHRTDKTCCLSVLDVATGRRLRQIVFPGTRPLLKPMLFRIAPDGRTAAVFGAGHSVLRLCDLVAGRPMPVTDGHAGDVSAVAVTADGRWAVSADGSEVRGWDLESGEPRWSTQWSSPRVFGSQHLAALPDGQTLLIVQPDGAFEFREVATGRLIRQEPPADPQKPPFGVAVTADGAKAVLLPILDGLPQMVNLEVRPLGPTGGASRRLPLRDLAHGVFSPDGRWLATVGTDTHALALVDTTTGQRTRTRSNVTEATPLDMSNDNRLVIAGSVERVGTGQQGQVSRIRLHLVEALSGRQVWTSVPAEPTLVPVRFSPDNRALAFATRDRSVMLIDAATGRDRLRLRGFETYGFPHAFTPDGTRLLTGHSDGTILVWDISAATRHEPAPPATEAQLDAWLTALEGTDATAAYAAVCGLADVPGQSVPLVQKRLALVEELPTERLRQWIADLDSPRFAVREAASKQIAELGDVAEPALRQALAANPSPEQRLRLQALLDQAGEMPSTQVRRTVRGVWALERAGTPEAVRVLEALAGGPPESRLTQEAREALARLHRPTRR